MRIYQLAESTESTESTNTFPPVLTSDQMENFILDSGLQDAFGELDYNDAKGIAQTVDEWKLTTIPVSPFGWMVDSSYDNTSLPYPPIVLFDGSDYEVLDGKHRIGMANDRGEQTIQVYLGVVDDEQNEQNEQNEQD